MSSVAKQRKQAQENEKRGKGGGRRAVGTRPQREKRRKEKE